MPADSPSPHPIYLWLTGDHFVGKVSSKGERTIGQLKSSIPPGSVN